ncbi:MAG: extracellular solute-binding protein, partial [Bacilli bacterium]|nr:extracellular solute-binding protein [Bacilli bacterium]
MKNIAKFILAASSALILTGCANSFADSSADQSGQASGFSGSDVPASELEKIMAKYDAKGCVYEYDGEECTIGLTHWDSAGTEVERSILNAVLKGFKARYPKINVNITILGDYEANYGNNISTGNVTDVYMVPDGAFTAWAGFNKMVNLTPYVNSSDLIDETNIFGSVMNRYKYDSKNRKGGVGSQLCLPKDVGPIAMYYNKDILDAMGVEYPASDRILSIEEATTFWKSLIKKDKSGNITRYPTAGIGPEGLVWSAGGDFLNATRDGFPTEAKDIAALKKGYQFLQDAYCKDSIMPPADWTLGSSADALFSMQKVATCIGGRYLVTSFNNLDFNWGVAYVPSFDVDPGKNSYSGSVGYAVSTTSQHQLASWKLVEYIASREGQEILSATGFQIPVY